MGRTTVTLLWLLAVVAFGAGCDGRSGSTPTSAATSVIYRGNGGEPGSLDPALAEDIHAFNILTDLYEGLVVESADGQLVPGVAESWIISDDGLTYTFTFRQDALWSNGDPLVAEDFVRAFDRVTAPSTQSAYSFLLEPVLRVSAVDPRTLEISLEKPSAYLLAVLAMPIAFPVPAGASDTATFSDPASFVGNGPYLLASHSAGGPTGLRRNPVYWDAGSVAVDEIVYLPIVDPATELNMYRAGELDITNTIPPERVQALKESMPDDVRIAPSLALYYIAFDLTEPPLDNVLLRQALSMAIDREQLVSLVGRGEQPAYGIVPSGVGGHVAAEFAWRKLPDDARERQARDLYREAGYDEESPLELKFTYDAGDIHEKVALVVSSMWRDVLGTKVTLEKKEWQFFLETRDKRSEWQVMRFAWFGDYNHASTFTNIFRSGDPQNLSRYNNPEYDRQLALAEDEADPARNGALITAAEALLLDEHPIAPLYFYVSKHLVNSRIAGFETNVLDRHPSKYLTLEPGSKK